MVTRLIDGRLGSQQRSETVKQEQRSHSYRIVRFVLILAGFVLLAVYILFIGSWLVSTGSWLIDSTRRQFQREIPPGAEDLGRLSLAPAWQYEADAKIRRIVGLAHNKLILYTWDRQFVAVDATSGESAWQHQSPGDITDLVTEDEIRLKDGLLAFSSFVNNNNYRRLVILDTATGQELWHHQNQERGFVASTFMVGDEYVYWAIRPHYLAFDRYTGELVWQSELETGMSGYHGLLYNGEELVIVRPDMYVLDANTGETKRSLTIKINSTPYVIHNQIIYVEKDESRLVRALDIREDRVLWERQLDIFSDARWSPLLREDRLYVNLNGTLGVLDVSTGEVIWGKTTFERGQAGLYSNPVFVGDTIYAILSDGSLRTLDVTDGAETGRVEYKVATEDAALYATDGMLFVSMGGSTLYAYTIASGE
jgi:outer membrane protein assembly factor BamB